MRLKTKSFITISFFAFFLLLTIGSSAAEATTFKPQISIPGSRFTADSPITIQRSSDVLAEYIKAIYTYAISIVGIVATIMLMFGGFTWLTAGGSGEKVGKARDIIFGALTGLVLALTSYTILNLISPDLVNFKKISIKGADDKDSPMCTQNPATNTGPWDWCPNGQTCVGGICTGIVFLPEDTGCCLLKIGSSYTSYNNCENNVKRPDCDAAGGGLTSLFKKDKTCLLIGTVFGDENWDCQ